MDDYVLVRLYQLRAGASVEELERLAASGLAEMQSWIAGVKSLSLVRLVGEGDVPAQARTGTVEGKQEGERYLMMIRFASYEAYRRWQLVEVEGADFWERFAAVMTSWEQVSQLVGEYAGEAVVDALFHVRKG